MIIKMHGMAREQAISDIFWKNQIQLFVLLFASSESLKGHKLKPTSKDEKLKYTLVVLKVGVSAINLTNTLVVWMVLFMLQVLQNKFQCQMDMTITISRMIMAVLDLFGC